MQTTVSTIWWRARDIVSSELVFRDIIGTKFVILWYIIGTKAILLRNIVDTKVIVLWNIVGTKFVVFFRDIVLIFVDIVPTG